MLMKCPAHERKILGNQNVVLADCESVAKVVTIILKFVVIDIVIAAASTAWVEDIFILVFATNSS
jgi:hypothetical protein